ncbi:MAG: hypothetical protein HZA93_13070 [Verrucomicrobia bacterium]|nr:hypothetical protein [Verrucomicrobiota bacterium]
MTPGERNEYFGRLWPAACAVCDWNPKDDAQRRAVTIECMRLVRGPMATASSAAFGPDEVTALFTYLRHLADPASLDKSARWVTCQEDYRTFNRAKQADWHERELYGPGKNKLDRNRFAGKASAAGGPLETLDADEVRKRHLTVASRHQRKQRQERRAGQDLASQTPASTAPAAPVRNESPKVDVPF